MLAVRIAGGSSAGALLAEVPQWVPRIGAILRADGLPPATVERLTRETRAALENVLRDRDGLWLLAPHPGAASEFALTAGDATVRVDRIFRAGAEPHTAAQSADEEFLWIVDYKTATHGVSGLDEFLAKQRAAYAAQLETYGRVLAPVSGDRHTQSAKVRLALYYPMIPRLIWW